MVDYLAGCKIPAGEGALSSGASFCFTLQSYEAIKTKITTFSPSMTRMYKTHP